MGMVNGVLDQESLESDARLERMDRVAVLHGEITAATREFLRALAESDRHEDWAAEGFGSCAEWLAWRIGVTRNTANEKVRAALALENLPLISEAMARGEISFTKIRALTRVGTPDNEADLLEYAKSSSAAGLEKMIRGLRPLSRGDEARRERARHARRHFSVFPDEEGMCVVKGLLDPEVAAVLMRAVEAANDALFKAAGGGSVGGTGPTAGAAPSPEPEAEHPTPAQRRADAVGLLAERALAAGFGGAGGYGIDDAPISGSRAERYQVMLHVNAATLAEQGEPGKSELEDGTSVTAVRAIHLTGPSPCCAHGSPSCGHALPTIDRRLQRLVLDRHGLPRLSGVAAVAGRLQLPGLRSRRRLAPGGRSVQVWRVWLPHFGDSRHHLRPDPHTPHRMVQRGLALRHRQERHFGIESPANAGDRVLSDRVGDASPVPFRAGPSRPGPAERNGGGG